MKNQKAICQNLSLSQFLPTPIEQSRFWRFKLKHPRLNFYFNVFSWEWRISKIERDSEGFYKEPVFKLFSLYSDRTSEVAKTFFGYFPHKTASSPVTHGVRIGWYFVGFVSITKGIHIECSKQFEWNLYFYVSGQSRLFWAVLKLTVWGRV